MNDRTRQATRTAPIARAFVAAVLALLAGCDPRAPIGNTSADGQYDAGAQMDRATKLGSYAAVMSDDMSLSGFDLVKDLDRYQAFDIPHAKADVKVSLFPRGIERAVSDLKRARALPGDLTDLDAAANRAIPALDRLLARVRRLDSYYATRGQLVDGFARGRKEHPMLLADYQAAIAAWRPLDAAYEKARDEKLVADAAFYRREGRMAEYYDTVIVQKAATMARVIDTPAAARDPQRAATADRTVNELLALIQRGRSARAGQAQDPNAGQLDNGVLENIEQMIGAWRELQRTPDADHHEAMMRPFSAAMQTMTPA